MAVALRKALSWFTLKGGRLVVHIVEMPIKCPVARRWSSRFSPMLICSRMAASRSPRAFWRSCWAITAGRCRRRTERPDAGSCLTGARPVLGERKDAISTRTHRSPAPAATRVSFIVRAAIVVAAAVIGAGVGLITGANIGGNWFTSVSFLGENGYEVTSLIGAVLGGVVLGGVALVLTRRT